jgi:hypothetical protein
MKTNILTRNSYWLKVLISTGLIFYFSVSKLQSQDIAPQIWNNANLIWNIDDQFAFGSSISYNVLLSQEFPWHEINFTGMGVYAFKSYFEFIFGLYLAQTKQSLNLSSFETRPYFGLRLFSNNQRRLMISNLSRLELRHFRYSDKTKDFGARFRNRTILSFAINRKSMASSKNLFALGYIEAFYSFDNEIKERFFNQFKYKLGLGYRFTSSWIVSVGAIYQDAVNTAAEPSLAPTTLTTNYVFDWGVTYIIQ